MIQKIDLSQKEENKFFEDILRGMDKQQEAMMKKADSIIENVTEFEENIHKQFALYSAKYIREVKCN
jgi:polyhydroxyalkanoate synthesis regulator phasin